VSGSPHAGTQIRGRKPSPRAGVTTSRGRALPIAMAEPYMMWRNGVVSHVARFFYALAGGM
jgi:hypothetical protein